MVFPTFSAIFFGGEILDMVLQSGAVAKIVLLTLLGFSLISWAIILSKWGTLQRARVQSGRGQTYLRLLAVGVVLLTAILIWSTRP